MVCAYTRASFGVDEILIYETEDGRAPFSECMGRQSKRLERVETGNPVWCLQSLKHNGA